MDDDSKKILLLKLVVGFLVFLAIMIFIIIILAIKNNNKRDELMETTTRRTLSGETTEVTSEYSTSSSTSSETTTESTTTTTTVVTQNTTSSKVNPTQGTTRSASGGGGSSYTPPTTSVIPEFKFTEISSGNASSYKDANNAMEWDLVNKINGARGKKLKVASELRNAAERLAETCCNGGLGYCKEDARNLFEDLGYQAYIVNLDASHYVSSYTSSMAFNTIKSSGKSTIIDSNNYNYMGVGVVQQSPLYNCVAVVVNE